MVSVHVALQCFLFVFFWWWFWGGAGSLSQTHVGDLMELFEIMLRESYESIAVIMNELGPILCPKRPCTKKINQILESAVPHNEQIKAQMLLFDSEDKLNFVYNPKYNICPYWS